MDELKIGDLVCVLESANLYRASDYEGTHGYVAEIWPDEHGFFPDDILFFDEQCRLKSENGDLIDGYFLISTLRKED